MTSAVIVSSGRVESWVADGLGMDASRVFRVYAPIDVGRYAASTPDTELLRELGLAPESRVIVNVARLAPVKGHGVLLDAMRIIIRRVPEAVLVLVGEPWSGQPEGLVRRAERLGIVSNVHFVGRREDVPRFLASAELCVSSSLASEENSRAVSEYMAAGCPVVGTGVGVVPELVVDGATGLIARPGDEEELAECIVTLLTDRERAKRMGAAGRNRAEKLFSREAFSSSLESVLDRVGIGARGGVS
jgi:glycosyltransferase involved in cell wall biosynthesis